MENYLFDCLINPWELTSSHCQKFDLEYLFSMAYLSSLPKPISQNPFTPQTTADHSHGSKVVPCRTLVLGSGFWNSQHGSFRELRIVKSSTQNEALVGEFWFFVVDYLEYASQIIWFLFVVLDCELKQIYFVRL